MERDFKGVWIPKEIWLSNDINIMCKVLLVEIDSLSKTEDGCYAGNDYFSKFLGISTTQVSKYISLLKEKGYIIEISFDGRKRILKSCFEVKLKADFNNSGNQTLRKIKSRVKENLKHINIYNNTNNNIINNNSNDEDLQKITLLNIEGEKEKSSAKKEKEVIYNEYDFVEEFIDKNNGTIQYLLNKDKDYIKKQSKYVDKLIKQGYDIETIKTVLNFIKQDDFWRKNILSVEKLLRKNKDGVPYIVVMIEKIKQYRPKAIDLDSLYINN